MASGGEEVRVTSVKPVWKCRTVTNVKRSSDRCRALKCIVQPLVWCLVSLRQAARASKDFFHCECRNYSKQ